MSLHERHLPINLPLHGFSFPNQLHSIHNPNLCCCIHLLSIFKRCCNWLLAQHMFPRGNGQQGLLLETWSKQCSILIEWSMDIIGSCNTAVQVLKEQSCPCEGVWWCQCKQYQHLGLLRGLCNWQQLWQCHDFLQTWGIKSLVFHASQRTLCFQDVLKHILSWRAWPGSYMKYIIMDHVLRVVFFWFWVKLQCQYHSSDIVRYSLHLQGTAVLSVRLLQHSSSVQLQALPITQ